MSLTKENQPPLDSISNAKMTNARARDRKVILFLLRQVRDKLHTQLFFKFLLWALFFLSTLILLIIMGGLLIPTSRVSLYHWGFYSILMVTFFLVVAALIRWLFMRASLDETATQLQLAILSLRDDITAALDFSRPVNKFHAKKEYHNTSESLATLHIENTAKLLQKTHQAQSLNSRMPSPSFFLPGLALFTSLSLLAGIYAWQGPKIRSAWNASQPLSKSTTHAKKTLVGDISLQFIFPEYAKMQSEFSNSTGNIRALVGTEVNFKTYPLIRAKNFEIVLRPRLNKEQLNKDRLNKDRSEKDRLEKESPDIENVAEEIIIPLRQTEFSLEANLVITGNASYEIRASNDKLVLVDPLIRNIHAEIDAVPAVSLTSPQGELEVSPEDIIDFKFNASDDFGLESVNGVYYFSSAPENKSRIAIDLPELAQFPKSLSGTLSFDLSRLKLRPKDMIVFQIEANDNNSLSGPGLGLSAPLILRVTSPENKHFRLIAEQQKIRDLLIDSLGSFLERPLGKRVFAKGGNFQTWDSTLNKEKMLLRLEAYKGIHDQEHLLLKEMKKLIEELRSDPLLLKRDFETFNGIYNNLDRSHQKVASLLFSTKIKNILRKQIRKGVKRVSRHEHVLEKSIIALDNLIRQEKIDAISDTQAEIREIRDRLKKLLEEYKKSKDPKLKVSIQKEIARLRQRMMELLERMQTQIQNLPKDHMNMEALEDQEMIKKSKDLAGGLERIEELLKKDDIDGAIEALDALTKNLNDLNSQMDSEFEEQQGSGVSELDKELNSLMDKVNDLEFAQRQVEKETRKAQLNMESSKNKEIEKMLDIRLQKVKKLLGEQIEDAKKIAIRAMNKHDFGSVFAIQKHLAKTKNAIKIKDLKDALEHSGASNKELRSLEFSLEISLQYKENRKKVRKKYTQAIERLNLMIPKQREISNLLRNIIAEAKLKKNEKTTDKDEFEPLKDAQKKVRKKAKNLKNKIAKSSKKFPLLQSGLGKSIKKAAQEMRKSEEGLKKRKAQQSLDHQRSALEELRKMKKSMQETLQKERQGNQKKRKGEKVAIPKNVKQKNTNIRDEIKKRMKDNKLNNYADEIERYYESLVE